MVLKIAQLGQPILRKKVADILMEEILGAPFQAFLQDMRDTLEQARGAGLAAPQVFSGQRLFLAAILPPAVENERPGVETFINPRLVATSAETAWNWEGCLSFPELLVLVERFQAVRVEYLDAQAQPRTLDLAGFPARVIQHEYDHLEGILTIDRAASTRHIIKASEIEAAERDLEEREQ